MAILETEYNDNFREPTLLTQIFYLHVKVTFA